MIKPELYRARFNEGFRARIAGVSADACPYKSRSDSGIAWFDGFKQAQAGGATQTRRRFGKFEGAKKNPSLLSRCNTCGRIASSPFRIYDARGKVVNGCVDDFHSGELITPSESARWHYRPEAKKIRAAIKRVLKNPKSARFR